MPIQFDSESRTFKLDTDCSSCLIKIHETGHILNLYYSRTGIETQGNVAGAPLAMNWTPEN